MTIRALLAAMFLAPVLACVPASAQEPVSTRILRAGNSCSANAETSTPQLAITSCQQAVTDLQTLAAANSFDGHESNLYWVMMALAHSTIGSKMGAIDGARTARTCAALEQAWSDYSHVIPSRSPADYAADMETMKTQAGAPVRLCRSEFGAPFGAPAVPAG